ncbi:kinetochore-associated protein 1 isoform X2 [Parasteatoda tepidariorum]|uniref:kinetochore-associated protein 1 isoform X1 n=1 Tax=Parasteatoda tepidariorum TaxID=114398 RepID=UPI001C719C04|nr:kinetochore-associated protein 1 [Parasteatoda tepidariorum]
MQNLTALSPNSIEMKTKIVQPFDVKAVSFKTPSFKICDSESAIHTASSLLHVAIASDRKVVLYNEGSLDIFWEIDIDSTICIALSEDSCFLLVAQKSGILSLHHIQQRILIWRHECKNSTTSENYCIEEIFINVDNSGFLNVYVLTEEGIVLDFNKLTASDLLKAVEENGVSSRENNMPFKEYDLKTLYPGYKTFSVLRFYRHSFLVGFVGLSANHVPEFPDFFNIEDMVDGIVEPSWEHNPKNLNLPKIFDLSGIKCKQKAVNSRDGRYIFLLHGKCSLTVICAYTELILSTWRIETEDKAIEDFTLHESFNQNSFVHGCKVGLLVASRITHNYKFEIRNYPSFETIYSVELSNYVQLVDNMPNQDCWYIFDATVSSDETDQKYVNQPSIKAIFEASPESRLHNLVNKKQFSEAEELAKSSNLNSEVIHKAKVNHLLNDLNKDIQSSASEIKVDSLWSELKCSLGKIEDVEYIKVIATTSLHSLESIERLLFCVKDWIENNKNLNGISSFNTQVNQHLNKLVTNKLLSSSNISMNFEDFLHKDLLEYVISQLTIGNLSNAFVVWGRHEDEIVTVLSDEVVKQVVEAIPSEVPSKLLIAFLSEDFFPPVISKCPNSVNIIAEWLIKRVTLMETSETELWPENAIDLLSVFFHAIQDLSKTENKGLISFSTSLSLLAVHKKIVDPDCCVGRLNGIHQKLKWLLLLKSQFNCQVPLSNFQDSKMGLVFAVLDRIDLQIIPNVIEIFARPYALDNDLDLDFCLEQYIKTVFQSTRMMHIKKLWEERLVSINNCIQSTNRRMSSALLIISKADVPWSECVKKLVQQGLECVHDRVKEFEVEAKLVGLKEILAKYGLKNFSKENDPNTIKLLVNFIFKQNRPSAIEDAKKVILSIFDQSLQFDVYYSYIQFALNQNKLDAMLDVFENLETNTVAEISSRLLRYVKLTLEDNFLSVNNRDLFKNVTYAGIYVIEYLKKMEKPYDDELLIALRCLMKLNVEFNMYVTLSEVLSVSYCQALVEDAIKNLLDNKKSLVFVVDSSKKQASTVSNLPSNLCKIYRLGDILQIHREKVVGLLITHGLQRHKYDFVLKLQQESIATQPSEETAAAIMQVVAHFYHNFDNIKDFSFSIMIDTIHHLSSLAIAYCNEDKMQKFLPFVKLTSYLFAIRDIIGEKSLDSSCFISDSYHKWKFYPLYQDEGFNLQSEIITKFVKSVMSSYFHDDSAAIEQNFFDVLRNLELQMEENGQAIGALRTLILFIQLELFKSFSDFNCSPSLCSRVVSIILDVIQNALSQRRVDLHFALDLFKALPKAIQMTSLKNVLKRCAGDLKRLSYVGKIGMEISQSLENQQEWSNFTSIYKKTSLLTKNHFKVTSHVLVSSDSNLEERWAVVKEIVLSPSTDLQTVHECCDAFQLPFDYVAVIYLNHKLLELEKQLISNQMRSDDEIFVALKKIEAIIWGIENEETLLTNFMNLKKKIGPYSYEILIFIEEQLSTIEANVQTLNPVIHQKNIDLLKFLKVYKRIYSPTNEEIEYWRSTHPMDTNLPDIANTRLSFNIFASENPFKIINPEVTSNTLKLWLEIAPILQLSTDHLVVVALKNQVSKYLDQYSAKIIAPNHDNNFVCSVNKMLEMINKSETAVGCATWIMNKMPSGGNKVIFAKLAVKFAQKWYTESQGTGSVEELVKRLSSLLQSSEIERILYKNNLPLEKNLPLTHTPALLVEHLIENYTFNLDDSTKICKAAIEICTLVNMNFNDVVLKFIFKWLNDSQTHSTNLDESFAHFDSPGPKICNKDSVEDNKIRITNLLLGLPENILPSMRQNILKYTEEMSTYTRAKFVFCLASVFGVNQIADLLGLPPENLEENLIPTLCSAELQQLGLAYPLHMLNKCNKVELLQKVLTSNSHNTDALVFCVRLCQEHNIWHASIWETILQRMLAKSMFSLLREILPATQGRLIHLWNNKIFISAWNAVFCDLLKIDSQDSKYLLSKVYKTLLRCPCPAYVNIEYLKRELKGIGHKMNSNDLKSIESAKDICTIMLIFKKLVEEQFENL